ncbi:Adenosine deaminase CECR1 [Pleurostoma richardsiae]|uniref:Adenosine deaminase CECR1 n=1 Tax=Pleurostoma richardsiae TaxID=41990 RepID=A0AA38VFP7_9PEZI|nr:Adenosine deaminase CECR1 [Pleurostoma richardsiae]
MPRMFIKMDRALLLDADYDNCRIQFLIRSIQTEEEDGRTWDVFAADYKTDKWMRLDRFLRKFREHRRSVSVDQWLQGKIVFNEEETHGMLQTAKGAWERFNARTQMMKGLFNYEKAYRLYVRACLHEFVDQNIQYAEVRVTFMGTNQIWRDDGCGQIDNKGIMELIIDECAAFHPDRYFAGLKIIYCVPRSFSPDQVMHGLDECLEFKLDNKFSGYIAGFDLVGEEEKGKPLKAFIPQFLEFKNKCTAREVSIPFLFHCGETLGVGTDTDGNLLDALLLGSKRIGHGFALARHPYIMERMKKRNVCVELCPISNEILGLTPRVSGHAMYTLLANNVHCTVNTDNGTIFGSKLSHDFYQVMVGKADMTLYGWRQLAEWSLEHSCMDAKELETARRRWDELWKEFVAWIVEEYGHLVKPPA